MIKILLLGFFALSPVTLLAQKPTEAELNKAQLLKSYQEQARRETDAKVRKMMDTEAVKPVNFFESMALVNELESSCRKGNFSSYGFTNLKDFLNAQESQRPMAVQQPTYGGDAPQGQRIHR